MKIQLSPNKIVNDALVVWNEPGPEVDIVMDIKHLTFKENSIEAIYTFHVLDHLFHSEVNEALANWKKVLKIGGELFIVVDDFEYVARALIGGDINLEVFNEIHAHPMNFRRENLTKHLFDVGFGGDLMRIWFTDLPNLFTRKHYELVVSAEKHV